MKQRVYIQILRLYIANKNLLAIYKAMLKKSENIEEDFKASIAYRNELRQNFHSELKYYLDIIGRRKIPVLHKLTTTFLFGFVTIEYYTHRYLSTINKDKCYKCELNNINLYYKVLCSTNLNKSITDLLLKQKTEIEEYLSKDH